MSAADFIPPAEAQDMTTHAVGLLTTLADAFPGHEDSICIAGAIALLAHAKTRNPHALRLFQIAFTRACTEGII